MSDENVAIATARTVARDWQLEAQKRRAISKVDQVADTLEYCASELGARLATIEHESEWMTVRDYARQEGVTSQTVRTWIRTGELAATAGAKGYRIRRGTSRMRGAHAA